MAGSTEEEPTVLQSGRVPVTEADTAITHAIAATLLETVDELTAEMTAEIQRNIDDVQEDLRQGTFHSCRSNLLQIGTMLSDELEPASALAPPEALHLAREFVRHNLPTEALLRAYRIGHAVFMRWWVGQLHERVSDQQALAERLQFFTTWSFTYIDAVSQGVIEAYMHERERWLRSAEALRADEVRAILDGRPVDELEAGRRLRYALDRRHVGGLVWRDPETASGEADASLERVAQEVAARVGGVDMMALPLSGAALAFWIGGRRELDLVGLEGWRSPEAISAGAVVALGRPADGLPGFRRSHQEAQLARRVGTLGCRSAGAVVRFGDVALSALLTADLDEARLFVERELAGLAGSDDASRRLAATLRIFLEEGASFVRASRRLGVHENTVAYRVRRAGEVLGHGVEERQLELRVALELAELLRKADAADGRRGSSS